MSQQLAMAVENDEQSLLLFGEKLLSEFRYEKTDNNTSGAITAFLTSLIGRGLLPAVEEVEIILFMVDEAQKLSGKVIKPLIQDEFPSYFSQRLQPLTEKQSWRWLLDPRHYYKGGVHRVEAYLLKCIS